MDTDWKQLRLLHLCISASQKLQPIFGKASRFVWQPIQRHQDVKESLEVHLWVIGFAFRLTLRPSGEVCYFGTGAHNRSLGLYRE